MYIEKIKSPEDVKRMPLSELPLLAEEIRHDLLEKLSEHGGHVGPNLGIVEATIALHRVFNSPVDKFVFDTSHQSYTHKMLTGRAEAFISPKHYDDVTGFSSPSESPHDHFTMGHTSTSISLACGLAKGRDLAGGHENVIALIGDGSLSGGEGLEGLNVAMEVGTNLIIVVNDNQMSIAENHGGLYEGLKHLRETNGTSPDNLFKAMGLDYLYVANGNDVEALIEAFEKVKDTDHPVVVHINTEKGRGYEPAIEHKEAFHFHIPFILSTGETRPQYISTDEDYSDLTCQELLSQMKHDPTIVAMTAGTPVAMGFSPEKRKEAGKQFVDVGIAEQTAVAMASGIAKRGAKPVFGVFSSFIQRAYDQLSQDLAINGNAATIVVFLGGLEGMRDVTHLGFFDIPLIANIPGITYLAPTSKEEYLSMLRWSINYTGGPVALRIPCCSVISTTENVPSDFSGKAKSVIDEYGEGIALIGLGSSFWTMKKAASLLSKRGIKATVVNPRWISSLDEDLLEGLKKNHKVVVTLEDGILSGGWGQTVAAFYGNAPMRVICRGAMKKFVDRYDLDSLFKEYRMTAEQIADDAEMALKNS